MMNYAQLMAQHSAPECHICGSTFDEEILVTNPCRHMWCHPCLHQRFILAIHDEGSFPAQCCGLAINTTLKEMLLSDSELDEAQLREEEYFDRTRVYCAKPTCSAYIREEHRDGDIATCPACNSETHIPCQTLVHHGEPCATDEEVLNTIKLAAEEEWKRCISCKAFVEKVEGCNEMYCR